MSTTEYRYEVVVLHDESSARAVACVNGPDGPLRAEAETPILALSKLSQVLARWPNGGSREWLQTVNGRAFYEQCRIELGMGSDRGQA